MDSMRDWGLKFVRRETASTIPGLFTSVGPVDAGRR